MRQRLTARLINGIISAIIVVFFIAHEALGSVGAFVGFTSPFTWVVWCGIVLVIAHVVVSVVTSVQQLTDAERPPSARKKRHLALKWVTGGALACAVAAHIAAVHSHGAASFQTTASGAVLGLLLCIMLGVHVCVGSKSLLKDLNIDRRYKGVFRIVVCALLAVVAVAVIRLAL